jgi:hypothetical protein
MRELRTGLENVLSGVHRQFRPHRIGHSCLMRHCDCCALGHSCTVIPGYNVLQKWPEFHLLRNNVFR